MPTFEIRGLMDPINQKPKKIEIRGKNKVIDGLEDPKSFLKYYTYGCGERYINLKSSLCRSSDNVQIPS